jgi:hypothetical protein
MESTVHESSQVKYIRDILVIVVYRHRKEEKYTMCLK